MDFIFHHGSDNDGRCCGAILHRRFPEAEIISYNYFYDYEKSFGRVFKDAKVVFADITPTMENLKRLLEVTTFITVFDHHESSFDDLQAAGLTFPGKQIRSGPGACKLVWEHYSQKPLPTVVRCIAEYDNWERTQENKMVHFGMLTFNTFPTNWIWDKVLDEDLYTVEKIKNIGKSTLSYLVPWYKRQVKSYAIKGIVDAAIAGTDHPCSAILINQGGVDSSIFDSLTEKYDLYFRVTFGKSRKWSVSVTTDRDDIDVIYLARQFEGGGHAKSSGFITDDLEQFFTFTDEVEKVEPLLSTDTVHA